MSGSATILRADARTLPLAEASVDLVVTSPPYFSLRSYTDGGEHYDGQIGAEATPQAYVAALVECTREWMRVLKPGGSIFVNLGDKYNSAASGQNGTGKTTLNPNRGPKMYNSDRGSMARDMRPKTLMLLPERYRIACVDDLGLIARAVVIWGKPNPLPESVTDRVCRSHEDWVHLVKQARYYADLDEIREPSNPRNLRPSDLSGSVSGKDRDRRANGHGVVGHVGKPLAFNPAGKVPGSVWTIPTEPLAVPKELGVDHFAAFPSEWPRRIILGWSPPGGTVLDPFGGTGTAALVAEALGRRGISVDRSADYCRLAAWRTSDPGQRAKARGLPKPAPVPDGQGDLFALEVP